MEQISLVYDGCLIFREAFLVSIFDAILGSCKIHLLDFLSLLLFVAPLPSDSLSPSLPYKMILLNGLLVLVLAEY